MGGSHLVVDPLDRVVAESAAGRGAVVEDAVLAHETAAVGGPAHREGHALLAHIGQQRDRALLEARHVRFRKELGAVDLILGRQLVAGEALPDLPLAGHPRGEDRLAGRRATTRLCQQAGVSCVQLRFERRRASKSGLDAQASQGGCSRHEKSLPADGGPSVKPRYRRGGHAHGEAV